MSENKLGQESAFPYEHENRDGSRQPLVGMNKRFYAACAAMQGLLASERIHFTKTELVQDAYSCADELLKQENL